MQPISIGRVVQYRLPERYEGEQERWRPATAVNVFPGTEGNMANLTVMLDGLNDAREASDVEDLNAVGTLYTHALLSVGSAREGTKPGEWRWPPRV